MQETSIPTLAAALHETVKPLSGSATDYDQLLDLVGNAGLVLIGEASHGSHEFYRERAEISKRLITEKGFRAVAVEADWPDAYRINRYVQGAGTGSTAVDSLAGFQRFPTWMWRNADVLDFVGWMRDYNETRPSGETRAGFYGLDLYSLYTSIGAVINYLESVDQEAAERARRRYACFDQFGEDSEAYGYAAAFGAGKSCEEEAVTQLLDLQERAADLVRRDGYVAEDELFYAEQNARLAKNAEQYYRTMFSGRVSSWNLRDQHMAGTLERLAGHLQRHGKRAKIVVWEHNSHIGDARATEVGSGGELTVGQLIRERHGDDVCLIGMTTYEGSVTAASDWGGPAERKRVRPALRDSYETLFHQTEEPRFFLNLHGVDELRQERLERAIGVIYRPESERLSHYFHARLPDQFDAVLHFDKTRAVEPLERSAEWESGEAPETFPSRF